MGERGERGEARGAGGEGGEGGRRGHGWPLDGLVSKSRSSKAEQGRTLYKNLDFYRSDLRSTTASAHSRPGLGEGLGGLVRASFVFYSLDKKDLDAVPVGGLLKSMVNKNRFINGGPDNSGKFRLDQGDCTIFEILACSRLDG